MQGVGRCDVQCPERRPAAQTDKGMSPVQVAAVDAVPRGAGVTDGLARKSARMKKFFYAAVAALALCGVDARDAHAQAGVRVGPAADDGATEAPARSKPKKEEKPSASDAKKET